MRIGALRALATATVLATVLVACASDEGGNEPAQGSPAEGSPTTQAEPAGQATVQLAETDLGAILVDAGGMTLYLFEADTDGTSTCYDDCASSWPAVIAEQPTAGDGVDGSLLGTTERDDGEVQVTYAGHPLYLFSGDSAPGTRTDRTSAMSGTSSTRTGRPSRRRPRGSCRRARPWRRG